MKNCAIKIYWTIEIVLLIAILITTKSSICSACVAVGYAVLFCGWCIEVTRYKNYFINYHHAAYKQLIDRGSLKGQLEYEPDTPDEKLKYHQHRFKLFLKSSIAFFVLPMMFAVAKIVFMFGKNW